MNITRTTDGETHNVTERAIFRGDGVWQRGLSGALAGYGDQITVANVQFAPGARTVPHRHSSDQVLFVTAGIGRVGNAQGEQALGVGDAVMIPAGEVHWHGAGDSGSPFAHLSITRAESETTLADD